MKIHESVDKVLNLLNSLKDDTNDAINNTPYILRRLSEFTDGELGDVISELEAVRYKAEELEDAHEEMQGTIKEYEDAIDEQNRK
ncbi:hypothetical protein [Paenibacillus glucanolyticus]|uniref:hypothetical protein n=1 Tax=Paenibacillus glucanolyticus TaxID=59843 RepID=UPI00128E2362|nr:hypothetical protein [Paenibacillus glucanolyticus]MPY20260.1 hypothetical protein [Paenibacillus glucanolyticus]